MDVLARWSEAMDRKCAVNHDQREEIQERGNGSSYQSAGVRAGSEEGLLWSIRINVGCVVADTGALLRRCQPQRSHETSH